MLRFALRQQLLTGLSSDKIGFYPFRGAPDITIKTSGAILIGEVSEDERDTSEDEDEIAMRNVVSQNSNHYVHRLSHSKLESFLLKCTLC